jgi:hypothetical protein
MNRKFANIGLMAIDLEDLQEKIAKKEMEMTKQKNLHEQ